MRQEGNGLDTTEEREVISIITMVTEAKNRGLSSNIDVTLNRQMAKKITEMLTRIITGINIKVETNI
ncbi:hypothetical protein DPMN_145834 [Dreissena polymorpha]|uniref:Uncharacterized protein n=1 Tax=Dreissena polymorpha TaxID=45954 RepID=A0A9D4F4U1_DREPO|nr:hypothetical protein DPMN_145834 [Dreissena polymorpha]